MCETMITNILPKTGLKNFPVIFALVAAFVVQFIVTLNKWIHICHPNEIWISQELILSDILSKIHALAMLVVI